MNEGGGGGKETRGEGGKRSCKQRLDSKVGGGGGGQRADRHRTLPRPHPPTAEAVVGGVVDETLTFRGIWGEARRPF